MSGKNVVMGADLEEPESRVRSGSSAGPHSSSCGCRAGYFVPVLLLAAFSITRLEFFVVGFVLLVAPLGWLAVTKAGSRRVETLVSPAKSLGRLGTRFDPARRDVRDGAVSVLNIHSIRR